ncbi:MAG: GNAT family N-acetyltransferase [Candidatus Nanoarchaeia archaeon]
MKLTTKRLVLRDIKVGDEISIRENINNLDISKWLLVVPYPYTKKDAIWWVNHCIENQKKKPRPSYELGIAIKPNNEIVGGIGLSKVDLYQGKATLGYWIGEDYWGNGYMYEAAKKIIEFGFNKLKLRRINVEAFAGNVPSNNLIKKLGFTYEGTIRKALRCKANDDIHDGHFYGMLKSEWRS